MKTQESNAPSTDSMPMQVPPGVARVLKEYQSRVRRVRLTEAVCVVVLMLGLSYLSLFLLDRVSDPSRLLRGILWFIGMMTLITWLPWIVYRWVWQSRRLDQVARILKTQQPRVGDHLLGIVELALSQRKTNQSEVLVQAALRQADREMTGKSFVRHVPHPRHRQWTFIAVAVLSVSGILLLCLPTAGLNSLQRWLKPWSLIERFTFTRIEPLPSEVVVPDSEETPLTIALKEDSTWTPTEGTMHVGRQTVKSTIDGGLYGFRLPPQKEPVTAKLKIGDVFGRVQIQPKTRPELSDLTAHITLPNYLLHNHTLTQAIRGGAFNMVKGSVVRVNAVASRELVSARLGELDMQTDGLRVASSPLEVNESQSVKLTWLDHLGLSPAVPLKLQLNVVPDAPPSIAVHGLKTQTVMMEQSVLSFKVDAADDFGIRRVGLKWNRTTEGGSSATSSANSDTAKDAGLESGEQIIYSGEPDKNVVASLSATLSPARDKIAPQSIELRVFAEDYMPDRPRQYSSPIVVHILSEADHATWLMRRIDAWMRQCFENYDREQQLFHRNQELSTLPNGERGQLKTLRALERQAAAEQSQSKRLRGLNETAKQALIDCTQNRKINPRHLEQLSGLIAELIVIADQKMPIAATHLQNASKQASQVDSELSKALTVQEELLSQYQSIVERMRALMRKIEGTSYATRLQALSREELMLGGDIRRTSAAEFGKLTAAINSSTQSRLDLLATRQTGLSKLLQELMSDMEGTIERAPSEKVKAVFDEMSDEEIVMKGKYVSDQVSVNDSGVAVAQCECLADSFYRWAEQLMLEGESEQQDGEPKQGNLPAELAVELMRILKRETDLREETRELEQVRAGQEAAAVHRHIEGLAKVQVDLAVRTATVIKKVIALPNGEATYGKDIERLTDAIAAMRDAESLFVKHETSVATIAAETDAIELLQNSRRSKSSKGGSGNGAGDGERSGADLAGLASVLEGKTQDSMARPGRATDLSTGNESDRVPEEFRAGMDRLYEAMEKSIER